MLRSITFLEDFRCFNEGERFAFHPGINLLVGDQGTGKSTLLQIIRGKFKHDMDKVYKMDADPIPMRAFDFETDNPRVQSRFGEGRAFMPTALARFASHGEFNIALLRNLLTVDDPIAVVIDEPDQALSPRSCYRLADLLQELAGRGHQIIASVHNPILIQSQSEVYSVEHREMIDPDEFLRRHREEERDGGSEDKPG